MGGTRGHPGHGTFRLGKGPTPEQIAQHDSALDPADVYAAIAYYLRHRDEVEEYLRARRRLAEEVREELEERFPSPDLRERLESRLG